QNSIINCTSCKMGAIASDIPENEANKLYKSGYYIGMSYQIIDDIIDFTSIEQELGKPQGNDILQGNITLPVLIAINDKNVHALLSKTFSNPDTIEPNDFNHLLESLKNTNAIEASYKVSNRYLDKALLELGTFPDHKAKVTLENI